MALKDCTFTVTIDGKTRTFDYDGLRVFLLKPKNMAAVAPSFAGRDVNAVREAERKKAGKQAPTRSESDLSFTVGAKDKVMAKSPDVLFTIQPGRQYFTLTGHLKERTGPAAGTYDEGVFLRNLPTDPDEARAAAEEFMRKVATGEGSGHAFTTERGELWAAAGRASYGLIPTPLTKEDLIGLNDELIGRRPMEVGKYKGTSLNEVMKRDPAYAVWAADYQTGTPTMREAGEYIKRHPDYKTARANLEAAWAKADTPGVQALLKKAGIRYFISGISATLMDKTYPYKDILKESGGKFDNQHKFWTVDLDGFNKLVGAVAGRKGSGPSTLRQDVEPDIVNEVGPLWRSTLGLAMESWPNKGTPEQLMAHIAKTRGATEEAKWVELNKLLEGKNTVTKQEVMDYLEANPFVLGEVVLQGEKIRYPESEVRLPGGQGEGELVITFPKIKGYKGHHFPHDTDSYLVHVRFVERRGVNGQRVLFVEEIQSDLHQQARKYGYATPEVVQAKIKELELKRKPIERQREELRDKAGKMAASIAIEQNLALKTLKEDAAFNPQKRNPLDQAAWVQDDDGVDERTLRIPEEFMSLLDEMERAGGVEGFTDSIKQAVTLPRDDWSRSAIPDETINTFEAVTRNGLLENVQSIIELRGKINELNQEALSLSWQGDRLLDEVRQLRKQMLPDAPYKQTSEWATLAAKRMLRWAAENGYDEMAWTTGEVQTERTGTEFYKFYDEILPKSLAKFIKQWGATIEQTDIEIPGKGVMAFPTVKMSARMKNAALRGMTLFQKEKLPSPQAPAKGKIDPADLVANLREKVDLTAVPPVKKSKHATGAEARQALQDLTKNSMQEEMELQRLYQELRRVRQPLLQGTRGMTQAQVDKLEGEFNAVKDAYLQALAKQRLRAIDEVAPGGLAGITWEGYQTEKEVITTGKYSSEFEKAVKGISKDAEQRVNEGVELFKRIVGDHPALRGKKLDVRILGQGEGNRRERYSFSPIDELEGTALAAGGGHVMLTAKSPNSVIVHEMGHWMEHAVPEVTKRISQFLKRRSKAELLSPLNALEVTNQYDDAELGVADEFIVPYIGKYYARGMSPAGFRPDWNRIYASEVLSMGLQYMYENPVKFAQQDPEMFDLIFDILRMGR